MVAHLLTVLLVKVDIRKKILKFKDTKVIALDRDIESKKKNQTKLKKNFLTD